SVLSQIALAGSGLAWLRATLDVRLVRFAWNCDRACVVERPQMTQEDTIALALSLSMLLATGLIFGALARHFHLPLVLGELIGGVVLGPTLIGRFVPLPFARL